MTLGDPVRLEHMLEATRKAIAYSWGRTRRDLDTDEMLALAITRLLEIIGEAAKGVSPKVRKRGPNIPWKQVSGLRDRLIHGYFAVDMDIVWDVLTRDLPILEPALEALLASHPRS